MNDTLKDIINEIESLRKDTRNYDSPYDRVASEQNEILDTCIDIINKHMEIEVGDVVFSEYTDKDIIVVDTSSIGVVAGIASNGMYYRINKENVQRTGKHYDEIKNILQQLRGE